MTPTGIRPKTVQERLDLVHSSLEQLRALPAGSLEEFRQDRRNFPAAESLLRRAIESLFDLARHLLAKGYGVGQLEYKQIARQCADRGIVDDPELAQRFVQIAGFRIRLVHHYKEVTDEEIYRIVRQDLGDLERLSERLRQAAQRLSGGAAPADHPRSG